MADYYTNITNQSDPAKTYTLEDFVSLSDKDNTTYRNYSILEKINNIEFVDHCLFDEYKEYIEQLTVNTELTDSEYLKYRYAPDLLAYDVYGSVQLDYFILFINNMVDPKEFNKKTIKMLTTEALEVLFSEVMQANNGYIEQNREDNNILE